jgi:leucyl-tRNA synthetase
MSPACLSRFVSESPLYDIYLHPILQASSDKIIREIELFGPDFERYEEVQAELDKAAEEKDAEAPGDAPVVDKSKAKKGKIVAKSTGFTYQFQIMESIGVPRADIKKFADPLHWLTYFPPIAIVSLLVISRSYFQF